MSAHLVPVRVTASLAGGIAHAGTWGIALDGLLASQLREQDKAAAADAGTVVAGLHDLDDPPDLPLPLARCGTGQRWHWAATCAWPVDGHGLMPDVRWWSGRVDHADLEVLADGMPAIVSERQGRYRARWMPLLTTVCSAVSWYAVGDPELIAGLLVGLRAIGKKRAAGHGQVTGWEVTPMLELDPWNAGHLHPDGSLGRPCPAECLAGRQVRVAGAGVAGIRPPYMHPARAHELALPTAGPA